MFPGSLGLIGGAAAVLLLILAFFVGETKAVRTSTKNDPPGVTTLVHGGTSVLQTSQLTPEIALESEHKARVAFGELEARLKQLPAGDSVNRTTLCDAFLRQHGTTILAARVRTQMCPQGR